MSSKRSASHTFEESLKRLETIVDTLEQGEVSLDKAVEMYEEGLRLSKECADKLKAVELRIKKLTKDMDGQLTLSDTDDA